MSNVAVKQDNQEDWQFLPIKDFAHTTSGGTPKRGVAKFYNGDVPWVKSGDLNDGHLNKVDEYITELGLEKSSAKLFKPGTLLIALYGATIGRLSILNFEASTNQAICGISVAESVDVKYLFYYLLSIRQKLIDQGKGGAQPNINQQIVKETVVPLAPPEQQEHIVAKIEELFSHIDAGIEALKKAKQLLKQYRQSVLKAAVTGELTKEWRDANKDKLEPASQLLECILKERRQKWEEQQLEQFKAKGKGKMPKDEKWKEKYKEPSHDIDKFFEVPEGWAWTEIGTITDMLSGHAFKKAEYTDSGVRLFQIANVSFGYTKWDEVEYLPDNYLEKWKHLKLEEGDVLMALNRPLLSKQLKITRLGKSDVPSILYQRVGKFKFYSDIVSEYFLLYMQSPYYINRLEEQLQGVNIPFINKGNLLETPISIPSCEEEVNMIIDEANKRLDRIERLDMEIDEQLIKANINKQTILSAAFAGKLVESSANDTDAKLLLDNIKTRTAIEKKQKTGGIPSRKSVSNQKSKKDLISAIYESFGLNKFSIDELLAVTEIDYFSALKLELFELLKNPIGEKYRLDMQFDEKDEKYIFRLVQGSSS